jgi:putative flippase GtrA
MKFRYLIAAAWNTAFGYFLGVGLYLVLSEFMHVILISCLANFVAISMSFATYKFFVFRSREKWWTEYLRCFLVYGGSAIIGTFVLWLMVSIFAINIWVAQALTMILLAAFSFFSHKNYTFKVS